MINNRLGNEFLFPEAVCAFRLGSPARAWGFADTLSGPQPPKFRFALQTKQNVGGQRGPALALALTPGQRNREKKGRASFALRDGPLTPSPEPDSPNTSPFPEEGWAIPSRGVPSHPSVFLISLLLLFVLIGAVQVEAAEVQGVVRLEGSVPEPVAITIEPKKGVHSTEGCGSLTKASQTLIVDPDGGIQNAVVWLDLPQEIPADRSQAQVLLDQKECVFSPHVIVIAPGEGVAIRNSDSILHNVRIFREGKPAMLMHQWQKADASDIPWRFTEPGRYIVRCGVHPWMYAWVVVASGLGAVTDREGRFTIPGVPPGRYTLHLWHETLGSRDLPLVVRSEDEILDPIRWSGVKEVVG